MTSAARWSVLSELASYGGFVVGIPTLVRRRYTNEEAQEVIRRRLAERSRNFLSSIERGFNNSPRSPYRALMRAAGCEPPDVAHLVAEDGVEGALGSMKDAGIYVTFEEFKGNRPIVRGSQTIETRPEDFDNPKLRRYYAASTGGSTGRPRRVLMDLEYLDARKPAHEVMMHAHGIAEVPMAQWAEIPPGHGLEAALVQSIQRRNLERWFTPIWDGEDGPGWRFRVATQLAVAVARRFGAPVPKPEHLPFDRADVIVRWVQSTLRRHGACAVRAHVSKALRIAVAAKELGVDLTGLTITSGGEPPTAAKVGQITSTGARFIANYFFMEAGPIGLGCTRATDASDQHFMKDHLAMIARARDVAPSETTVPAFYCTTLLPSAPKLMLNVELDDYGVVEQRVCGCPLGELGLDTHLREVRSFSKLTGEGVTLIGSDMERILEEDLPSRFGGSPLDYQLLEEEDEQGFTRLTLLVDPRLDIGDELAVVSAIHESLARNGGGADVSRGIWKQAGTLRVRRQSPVANSRGKIWPLHTIRITAASTRTDGDRPASEAAARAGAGETESPA